MSATIERARGRWTEILPRLGIAPRFLTNKHGPCPMCGGKDRYRFDNKDGSGSYICGQCGAGWGFQLVAKFNGWDSARTLAEIDKIIGTDAPLAPIPQPKGNATAKRLAAIEQVINEADRLDVVQSYLQRRGLSVCPGTLRGHPALAYYDDDGAFVGKFPAMIACLHGADGKLQSVHRTYLTDSPKIGGKRKKAMSPIDTMTGGAVRLFEPTDTLGVAEGIETALAAFELFDIPTWAALGTAGLEGFEPPAGLRRLVIYADNDRNYAGQKAAFALANRLVVIRKAVPEVEVRIAPDPGSDWLDVINGKHE